MSHVRSAVTFHMKLTCFEVNRHFTENSDIQHSQHSTTANLKQLHSHSKMAKEHSIKFNIFFTLRAQTAVSRPEGRSIEAAQDLLTGG